MENVKKFAQQYGPLASAVGERLGVSPDVLLGQWGLETGWGSSVIPGTNNLGNIKDFSGRGVKATDNMTGSRDAYRAYDTPQQFGDDFVNLLARRYSNAIGAGEDAKKFATALKSRGYAEDPDYVSKIAGTTNLVRKVADGLLTAVSGTAHAKGANMSKIDPAQVKWDDSPSQPSIDVAKVQWDDAPREKKKPGTVQNIGVGVIRGLANIGATILEPIDAAARALGIQNDWIGRTDRREKLDQFARENADTDSLAYQGGKLGAEVGATLPVGGLLGKAVTTAAAPLVSGTRAAPVVNALGQSLATGGFRVGQGVTNPLASMALRTAGGAATGGASVGLIDPEEAGVGAVIGGALPGAVKGIAAGGRYAGRTARSIVDPFTEAGRDRIASSVIRQFSDGGRIAANADELVPGSVPTLAQATGNAGISSLERGMASSSLGATNAFAERALANNAARVGALDSIAGSPAAREAAIAAREAAVSPLYAEATAKVAPFDRELKSLLDRPSMQKAIRRAEQLAQERGGAFSLSREPAQGRTVTSTITVPGQGVAPEAAITRNVSRTTTVPGAPASIAGEGAPRAAVPERSVTTTRAVSSRGAIAGEGTRRPAAAFVPEREATVSRFVSPRGAIAGEGSRRQISEVSGQDLQTLKMAMDALLDDPASGIAGKEIAAVRQTRDELVNWMEKHIPEFTQARQTYAEMSKPLAQMDIAQRLIDRYASATRDLSGNPRLRAEAFNRALQDEGKLLKNSGAFAGYRSLEDVFTPEQLRTIRAIAEDLSRETAGSNAGRAAGSNTFQNLATNNILENALPGPVNALMGGNTGPLSNLIGTVGNWAYKSSNEAIQNRLLEMLLQPQSGLAALQNVGGNQLTGPLGGNALLQRLAPNLLPAGTVGINVLSRPGSGS